MARKAAAAKEKNDRHLEAAIAEWDPKTDPAAASSDPFKTLFVGRLSYDIDEAKLRREFEQWGPIKSVRIVTDRDTAGTRVHSIITFPFLPSPPPHARAPITPQSYIRHWY